MIDRAGSMLFIRFVAVGTVNTGFAFLAYAALLWLGAPPWFANLGALALGIMFSFVTLGSLVYGGADARRLPRFVASWLAVYAVQTAAIYGLIHLGLTPLIAGLVVLPAAALTSFAIQRLVVFR